MRDDSTARERVRALAYTWPGLIVGGLALAGATAGLALLVGELPPVWFPSIGLAVLAVLWAPPERRVTVGVIATSALAVGDWAAGEPLWVAVGLGLSTGLEIAAVATVMLRQHRSSSLPGLLTMSDVTRFVAAVFVGLVVVAAGAVVTTVLTSVPEWPAAVVGVVTAHAAALFVLVPLGLRLPAGEVVLRPWEPWSYVLGTVVLAGALFWPGQQMPMVSIVLPPLVWSAMRLPPRWIVVQIGLISAAAMFFASLGGGPVGLGYGVSTHADLVLVQTFVVFAVLVAVPLSIATTLRRASLRWAESSGRLLHAGFENSIVGMLLLRRDDVAELTIVELNRAAAQLLGQLAEDLRETSWSGLVSAECRQQFESCLPELRAESRGWRGDVEIVTSHGNRWVDMAIATIGIETQDDLYSCQIIDTTARRQAEDRLHRQATTDPLTGLINRTALRESAERALIALSPGEQVVALEIDLDNFKLVNDSAGHPIGDLMLLEVARRLRMSVREQDEVARLGGDEFVVLCAPGTTTVDAAALAQRILKALSSTIALGGTTLRPTASIGIAASGADAGPDDLLRDVDAAMYAAKDLGKARAVVFDEEHRTRAERLLHLEAELRAAIERDELEVYLQPVVSLTDDRVVGAEALVRWNHPTRGLLAPGSWLDVAESCGLMPQLGEWVLRRAIHHAASWPTPRDGPDLTISVNVSARQLETPGFHDVVHTALADTGFPEHRVVLEFTETQLDEVSDEVNGELKMLRRHGVGLAADDFGTGYSPMTRIIDLPLTEVKLDRRFVTSLLDDGRNRAVVGALIRLSHSLSLTIVAEGVELPEHAEAVRAMGADLAQGYLYSRPLPPQEFVTWLNSHPTFVADDVVADQSASVRSTSSVADC